MIGRLSVFGALMVLGAGQLFGQGLNTSASKEDWEEINFEFNSSTLSDGYPSLLRISELLSQNPSYKVTVKGHTDVVGGHPYNDKLALARANAVKSFLEKYGAKPTQITVDGSGKRDPKVDNGTKEGRFMNRRVVLAVTDGSGKTVGSGGGAGDAIKALEAIQAKQDECCSQILKRLDKLDEILAALNALKADHDRLRAQLDALQNRPAPAAVAGAAGVAGAPGAAGPGVSDARLAELAKNAADAAIARMTPMNPLPKFSLLGLNIGSDNNGAFTFTGKGRYFSPFSEHVAFQAQGEYLYFKNRAEGQADFGLVNRWKNFQMGGFTSFKTVKLGDATNSGTLGQAAFTADYLFGVGRVGAYLTKAFMSNPIVGRTAGSVLGLGPNVTLENYLRVSDQAGGSGAVSFHKNMWLEGNLGYIRTAGGNSRPGGTARLVFPLNNRFAFTAEGGVNETLIGKDTNGRATFGILFGNFLAPKEYKAANQPVPVDVPRIRYESLTRTIRSGNSPPVANAGADQNLTAAATVTLDGSASFDPDNDPLTYQWTQVSGPTVSLSAPTAAKTTFPAAAGQTYGFLLTVKDSYNAQSVARVNATVAALPKPVAAFTTCQANPSSILPGASTTLSWAATNAENVVILNVGQFAATGSTTVSPTVDTTYTLTANASGGNASCTVNVTIQKGNAPAVTFAANPVEISAGDSSTLSWNIVSAQPVTVTINQGIGTVPANGTRSVSPATTTTYTLTATNVFGTTTGTATITVYPKVKILSFTVTPNPAKPGDIVTFTWRTENATEVYVIDSVGLRDANGSLTTGVPAVTTTYTMTAVGKLSTATAQVTLTVTGATATNKPPVAVIAGGPDLQTNLKDLNLSSAGTFDPDNDTITYNWALIQGSGTVTSPTAATTAVHLDTPVNDVWIFELTVTDSKGAIGKNIVRVTFTDKPVTP